MHQNESLCASSHHLSVSFCYNKLMCGRYLYFDGQNQTVESWIASARKQMDEASFSRLSLFEVFPSQSLLAITADASGKAVLTPMIWGYPGSGGKLIINARSETAEHSRFFAGSSRCLIGVCGYYEWSQSPRRKYYFTSADAPVYLAALYKQFEDGLRMVILTEDAVLAQAEIHDRQPVMFDKEHCAFWCRNGDYQTALTYSMQERLIRPV